MNPTQGGWLILVTIGVAMVLAIMHLPESWPQWLGWIRPAWISLVIFYWVMELPHRLGLISAWIVGLCVDVLYADPLGLNGFLLAAITYFAWRFYERLRMYSVVQQCSVVFILIMASESVRMMVQDLVWDRGWTWAVTIPALTSTLLWPFVYLVLHRLQVQVRVE